MKRYLSCFVIVKDEGDRLERCLKSLHGWVDQLIVLDSGSSDNSVEIAKRYTSEVYQTDWPGFGAQRNRALSYCRYDWVLNIDADEEVSFSLRDEILAVLSKETLEANVIKLPWQTVFLGSILKRGRYSAPQGKLFYKPDACFKEASVHETLVFEIEKTMTLSSPLFHYSWRSYQHAVEKHTLYAALSAKDKFAKGKRTSLGFACLRLLIDFMQQYILRMGILDGKVGLLMAIILAQYGFNKYAALWAMSRELQVCEKNE